jgi:capsular polysaccharide biosynthesis protein
MSSAALLAKMTVPKLATYRVWAYQTKNKLKERFVHHWWLFKRLPSRIQLRCASLASRLFPRLFPIKPERLHPPKHICKSTADWVSTRGKDLGASFRSVDASHQIVNPLPKTVHDSVRQQFVIGRSEVHPSTFVATIPSGRVWGDGFVITPDDQILRDVSIDFRELTTRKPSVAHFWRLEPLVEIDGAAAVLSTDGGNLYYHWLYQLLPRFELIRRAGMDPNDIGHFVVNSLRSPFQRQSLALLGIDEKRVIESSRVRYLRARELIVPSIPIGGGGSVSPWMCDFLRRTFLPPNRSPASSSRRRLYLTRAQAEYRRVLNEDDVIARLARRGFETIPMEKLSMSQQAEALASCDVVVAPHGGGLSNLIFCTPGTKVIEIFSPELVAGFYWRISNQIGLDYYYVLGKGTPGSWEQHYPQSWSARSDIDVDLHALENTLDLAGV